MPDFTAIVAGGGPAGLSAAILLAQHGVKTALITPEIRSDPRTIALMAPSVRMLAHMGLWPGALQAQTAPLRGLQIIDDTGNLVQSPTLKFSAQEIGEEAFGWNIPLSLLVPALQARAESLAISMITGKVQSALTVTNAISVTLDTGATLTAQVCLAADGSNSVLREAAGIETERWSYDQDALVTSFSHTAPHDFISIETHKRNGAFTTVPMPGNTSALVWMERPARCAELLEMSDARLAAEIQAADHGKLGLISNLGPRRVFPMRGLRAKQSAARRTMLIGEASHVFPPIGAQGLNMSLRDAAHAADLIIGADDAGSDKNMEAFRDLRRSDIFMRQSAIDFMNTSLLAAKLPLDIGRVAGLSLVRMLPPLRNWIMREGLSPSSDLPAAMRG
jgi:2-octaprenyl-6-methoxyphenol hydroxylase